MIKNKKAEITTKQIVTLIILIVSFVIILFLLFRLNLGRTSDKEICHNSVVLKATGKGLVGELDCKTDYLCISGGGKCEGISPTTTIEVNPEDKEEIMKAIADEMADCWWMFGEGDLNYVPFFESLNIVESTCAICSIVKFDDKILEKIDEEEYKITYREFYEYLNNISKTESETYFTYLYDFFDINEFQKTSPLQINIDTSLILGNERYAIVTGFGRNWHFGKDYISPHYLKIEEIDSELGCLDFITKA